jgi:electron transfer flavoprotein alpha subunit
MATFLVVGETADGALTKLSTEVATLARTLAEASGGTVRGIIHESDEAAKELAAFTGGDVARLPAGPADAPVASTLAFDGTIFPADYVLLGATPDGRDAAGMISAYTGKAVLTNATGVTWEDDRPVVEMSVFGGKLTTRSTFTAAEGIITIRPNTVTAEAAPKPGVVDAAAAGPGPEIPAVKVVDRVEEAGAEASLEEARIIVSGGRGVGSTEGFALVEELARELGGVVGATRAAVDSGWIPYARQIGQTGKIVKPTLYLALGVSGAIQHKVGMQTAETIVAINRDPDAPIAEFADVLVVGDLFEVGPALAAELRARRGGG